MPRISLIVPTTGIVPPQRWKTGDSPKPACKRLAGELGGAIGDRDDDRRCAAVVGELDLHVLRASLAHGLLERFANLLRILIRNEPHRNLRGGFRGDDGFGALALISGGQPVYVERGSDPESLQRRVSGFATQEWKLQFVEELFLIERQLGVDGSFLARWFRNIVIEAGDVDRAVGIVERADDLRTKRSRDSEPPRRIRRCGDRGRRR